MLWEVLLHDGAKIVETADDILYELVEAVELALSVDSAELVEVP